MCVRAHFFTAKKYFCINNKPLRVSIVKLSSLKNKILFYFKKNFLFTKFSIVTKHRPTQLKLMLLIINNIYLINLNFTITKTTSFIESFDSTRRTSYKLIFFFDTLENRLRFSFS